MHTPPALGGTFGYGNSLALPATSATLAFASTIHIALALLRKERGASRLIVFASFLFAASPWLLPSPAGLVIGIAVHLAWFVACERLVSRGAAPAGSAPSARPASTFVEIPVLSVRDETPDIRTFRLARPPGFEFRAGQFMSVRVPAPGRPLVRCYTISSAPEARGYLEISVKRQGVASAALHDGVREGASLSIRGPGGHFLYPDRDLRPLVLLGGGVGATPLMSMLRHAAAVEPLRPITFILSVRADVDVPFRSELEELSARHPSFRIVIAVTRGTGNPSYYPGRIDEKLVRSVVPAPEKAVHFLCGPATMIDATREILARAGVPAEQVHTEAFEAAVAWAARGPGNDPADAASRHAGRAAGGVVEFVRSGASAPAPAGRTLLDAAEAAGVAIDFSCRSGICGTCRTRLLEGEVDAEGGALGAAERTEGWILPCIAFARGHCVIDA